eukprot:4020841-Pleurochrysis_carterae.AAC.1
MTDAVEQMPLRASSVEMGDLYFVILPDFEGEFRVGIGRPEVEEGIEEGRVMVSWLQRSTWSNNPDRPDFQWSGTPNLVAARHG